MTPPPRHGRPPAPRPTCRLGGSRRVPRRRRRSHRHRAPRRATRVRCAPPSMNARSDTALEITRRPRLTRSIFGELGKRIHDAQPAGAAAEVRGQCIADGSGVVGTARVEQRGAAHHDPGRAEAALRRAVHEKGVGDRVATPGVEPLERRDPTPAHPRRRGDACDRERRRPRARCNSRTGPAAHSHPSLR